MKLENYKRDYVSVTYNEIDRPFTDYSSILSSYLVSRYKMTKGTKLLDLGCGRGEFLRGFIKCGIDAVGVDISLASNLINNDNVEVLQSDIESDPLPYNKNTFDCVFSKSVLEHFYYPEKIIEKIYHVLKPGGLVIIMVPDWESIYKTFYLDYTHRMPFMKSSLRDILVVNGFNKVRVEKFIQLPFLWNNSWFLPFVKFVKFFLPDILANYSKFVRFSKEGMLLASAIKPYIKRERYK
jgi:SAM-dependent methyltransferase